MTEYEEKYEDFSLDKLEEKSREKSRERLQINEENKQPDKSDKVEEICQWSICGTNSYAPAHRVVQKVPAGVYHVSYRQDIGHFLVMQKSVLSDELIDLPIPEIREIVSDIEQFWKPSTKEQFKLYDVTYKRGIIVWGPPGNGKSMMMQLIIRNLVKRGGIVLTLNTVDDVSFFLNFAAQFRTIEPDRALVVILEDIDNVIDAGSSILSSLMNTLDGVNQIDNVVYLATTNYVHKLEERISNRPSRFDRKYEIGLPSEQVRKAYLLGKMNKKDLAKNNINEWINKSEGLSLSHLKELIVSVCILGKKLDDVLVHFAQMKRNKGNNQPELGFGKR